MNTIPTVPHSLGESEAEKLYKKLNTAKYNEYPYQTKDKGEDMALVEKDICGWCKPQYLLDHRTRCAYTPFVGEYWRDLDDDDVNWESLNGVPEDVIARAKAFSTHFPTIVFHYEDGIAKVEWQINPDGRYYEDEDGFGMTDDEEIALIGYIDRTGKVVKKFTYIPVSTYRYGE